MFLETQVNAGLWMYIQGYVSGRYIPRFWWLAKAPGTLWSANIARLS